MKVVPTRHFLQSAKKLSKKYPSLKTDLSNLGDLLVAEPTSGAHLGQNIYKVRLAITSKGKGKSGGGRVITYLITENEEIFLIEIYDKGVVDTISIDAILDLIKRAGLR